MTTPDFLLPGEDRSHYERVYAAVAAECRGIPEILVDRIALYSWRLERIASMEHAILAAAGGGAPDDRTLSLLYKLSRYEDTARNAWLTAMDFAERFVHREAIRQATHQVTYQ